MAEILKASAAAFARAVHMLENGQLVALPTETVYGLAAHAYHDKAVQHVYAVKQRPTHNPLILHILNPENIHFHAHTSPLADHLIAAFWPGPLTLVVPRKDSRVSHAAGAGLDTIAVRCPNTAWRAAFLDLGFTAPIIMPSANMSGRISPTEAAHVAADIGDKIDLIIDDGACQGGVESTVLRIDGDSATLLRPGPITAHMLAPLVTDLKRPDPSTPILAPGMLKSHYAPRARVRLNACDKKPDEAYLAFGITEIDADDNLSKRGDLAEAAHRLFAALRRLDQDHIHTIAVAPIPHGGLGTAINDRLQRAAADR